MNAKAIFSLYLYFFITYFITFLELANHSREAMQRSRLFSTFFPPKSVSNVTWDNNNTENRRTNVCAIASVHGCDWLVLEKCKK